MKRITWQSGVAVAALLANAPLMAQQRQQDESTDTSRTPDERAALIVAQMTIDEKIAMVNGKLGAAQINGRLNPIGASAGHVQGVPRLGIPDLYETDASLGIANGSEMRKGDVATALPSSLLTASTFDPGIAEAGGRMIGSEARAKGFNVLLDTRSCSGILLLARIVSSGT